MATVTKLVQRLAWDGGAILIERMNEDGLFLWQIGTQAKGIACGLSRSANNGQYSSQSHTWFFSNGVASVKELGVTKVSPFAFIPDSTFSIVVRQKVVYFYYHELNASSATLVYTSATPAPSYPLVLDCAMYAPGDSVYEADFISLTSLEDTPPGTVGRPDQELLGATIDNEWYLAGFGAELPNESGFAYDQWILNQVTYFTSDVGPDSLENALQPFVAYMVDGSIPETSGYAANKLPYFTNTFSYEESPEIIVIENQIWLDDLIEPGNDYAPTITNSFQPFLAFGSEVTGTFLRNKLHPFTSFCYDLLPDGVYFNLSLPMLRGYQKTLGLNGDGGIAVWPTIIVGGWGAETLPPNTGKAEFPSMTATGWGGTSGKALFPTLVAQGTGTVLSGGWGIAEFPTIEAYGEGVSGGIGDGTARFPTLVAKGSGVGPSEGRVRLPTLVAKGTGIGGGLGSGKAKYPTLTAKGTGPGGGVGSGRIKYPTLTAFGTSGSSGLAKFPFPVFYGEGVAEATTAPQTPKTYLVNLATGALTAMPELEGVVALYAAHGRLYGRKANNSLVAFDVPASLANPVGFHVRTASDLLDEPGQRQLKRLDTVYFIGRFGAGLDVKMIVDEKEFWPYITRPDLSKGIGPHKFNPGRGVRFHEVAFDIRPVDNDAVTLSEILPLLTQHGRKPK